MRTRTWTAALLVVCLLALSGTLLAAELPYDTNSECLECHDALGGNPAFVAVDFSASTVDYARCNGCHYKSPHYDTGDQCNLCHLPWPDRTVFYDGSHILAGGFYDTATSLETDPSTLHEIHVNGSWLKGLLTLSGCDECHQNASCSACHTGDVAHGPHTYDEGSGTYGYDPVTYVTCDGDRPASETVTCVNAACHGLDAAGTPGFDAPLCTGCHASQHDGQDLAHDPGVVSCGDSGCHDVSDISVTHGATAEEPLAGCDRCHAPQVTPSTSDCAECHGDAASGHHEIHESSFSTGCYRCHSPYLDDEHAARGLECAACHQSADPVVVTAIATGDRACATCHPTMHWRKFR